MGFLSSITSIAGGLIGANESANAAKDAASLQSAAGTQASGQTLAQYQQNQATQAPWLTAGTGAINKLSDLTGTSGNTTAAGYGSLTKPFTTADFVADPGYQFSLDQGQKALERSSAAKGGLLSGAAIKAAQTYGQGTAAQEYQDVYNRYNTDQSNIYSRLAGLSNSGQSAATNLGAAGATATQNSNEDLLGAANVQAAGKVGAANAYSTGLTSAASSLGNFFNNPAGIGGASGSGTGLGSVNPSQLSNQAGTFFGGGGSSGGGGGVDLGTLASLGMMFA